MPATARQDFNEDIARAEALHAHGGPIEQATPELAADLFRAAVVLAVGALDAYLCDAYVDCLTRALRACRADKTKKLPADYRKELLPAGPLVSNSYTKRVNWALRMAARARMEKDNLLQLGRLKDMFNPVLPTGQKLWVDLATTYVALNRPRLTGTNQADFTAKTGKDKQKAREKAAAAVLRRIGVIVQRRHDVVHNCDRPKTAIQGITRSAASKMIADIKSFATILDDHLEAHRLF